MRFLSTINLRKYISSLEILIYFSRFSFSYFFHQSASYLLNTDFYDILYFVHVSVENIVATTLRATSFLKRYIVNSVCDDKYRAANCKIEIFIFLSFFTRY